MRRKASLLCLVIFVGLASCDSNSPGELSGQVFIVTEGAVNIRLGLVEVTAIPEKDVLVFIAKKKAEAEKEKALRKEKYDAALRAHDAVSEQLVKRAMFIGATKTIKEILKTADDPIDADTQEAIRVGEIYSKAKKDYYSFPTAQYCLNGLPKGIAKATTDADGKFLIKIPRQEKYMLAAHASRLTLGEKEEYFWLVKVSLDGTTSKSIMLSNNNLFTPDSVTSSK